MQIVALSPYERTLRWCDPRFVNGEQRVEFALSSIYQVKVDEDWKTIPAANQTGYKTIYLSNNDNVVLETGVLAGEDSEEPAIGFYYWLLGMTAAQAGITAPATDVIFEKIANKIEGFLDLNNLW